MLFSSIPFLYYFFPMVLLFYFLAPKKIKNAVLLIFSLIFYGWGEPKYVFLMLASILVGYLSGLLIEKLKCKRLILIISIILCISSLLYFKYMNFFIDNFTRLTGISINLLKLALPIGISFYTFQIISYLVDVYRGDVKAQRNIINLAAYVALFAQLIAGPIVRYSDIEKQLSDRDISFNRIAIGIRRFTIGLSKKILLANVLGQLIEIFRASQEASVVFYWIYAICYALHIYFDFSGYSDMAIGIGKILGFEFMENFNYPFISKTVTEFWRRWHISLGSWFRDYVYIPLGGNRVSKIKWIRNIFIVWMLTGFWHGADWNFILWGLLFAILLLIEKLWLAKFLDKHEVIGHIYLILVVIFSFMIFNAADLGQIVNDIKGVTGFLNIPFWSASTGYYLRSYMLVILIAIIGATPYPAWIAGRIAKLITVNKTGQIVWGIIECIYIIGLLLVSTGFLIDGSFNPFLYFRF